MRGEGHEGQPFSKGGEVKKLRPVCQALKKAGKTTMKRRRRARISAAPFTLYRSSPAQQVGYVLIWADGVHR